MVQEQKISIKELLETGAHFGHQKKRWNPKMKRYIFEERNGIYIIDLAKTMQQIKCAFEVIESMVTTHQSILFVGTKKQAKVAIQESAERCGELYVSERWLGGMLTNFSTIRLSIKTLGNIEQRIISGSEELTKKELTLLNKERRKLERNISGIRSMRKLPSLLIVVDTNKEHIAVAEANKLGIPVMGLVDTNCDPDPIDHVIACNDDALKSIKLILFALSDKIIDVKKQCNIAIDRNKEKESSVISSLEGEEGVNQIEEDGGRSLTEEEGWSGLKEIEKNE